MNSIYRTVFLLLAVSLAACTSTQLQMSATNGDEDKDIGLGGTGMLAENNGTGGTGMTATGIVGKITGYGSVFVNGIEIEYSDATAFTIDGKAAEMQQLTIGDIVEVLTADDRKHTHALSINLRHELIGVVDSVDPNTFSFTVHGQSVVQPINEVALPRAGSTVAVSGFRMDDNTILASRTTTVAAGQSLLRTDADLPFEGKTSRWLVQTHVQNDKAVFDYDGVRQTMEIRQDFADTYSDRLGIKILKLHKSASGQLELDHVVDTDALPRGQQSPPGDRQDVKNLMQKRKSSGAMQGAQDAMPGPAHDMKR